MRNSLVVLSLVLQVYGVWAQSASQRPISATASVHFPPAAVAAFQKIEAERIAQIPARPGCIDQRSGVPIAQSWPNDFRAAWHPQNCLNWSSD